MDIPLRNTKQTLTGLVLRNGMPASPCIGRTFKDSLAVFGFFLSTLLSVSAYLLLLTNSVGSVHCLQIHLRIPVTVKQEHHVCCVQVDPKTASPER